MEEDVLNALQTRTAYLPGGFDREGKIIIIVNIINDLQLWNRKCLELSITYLKHSLSASVLQQGVTIIVDAQKSTTRITRSHARIIYALFVDITVNLYLVRAECFWEKHVETCTKSHTKGEPIALSKSRLSKYFDMSNLPEELGGTLQFNYDLWLQQRKSIDEFKKAYQQTISAMEALHVLLLSNKSLRPTEADIELKKCTQMHATVQRSIEEAVELGNRILMRLTEAYAQPPPKLEQMPATNSNHNNSETIVKSPALALTLTAASSSSPTSTGSSNGTGTTIPQKQALPPDLNCERTRIELRINEIEKKQTEIRTAWLELLQCIREARELAALEEGVSFVTNWILNTAEQMLNRQQTIGCDVRACEALRSAHDALELECRETYGFYAELLYKINIYGGSKDNFTYKDLMSQKDFMNFVCRSFATRLERRRNVLITSLRFFRLVTDYFDRTTVVFESLVMSSKTEDFDTAAGNLQKLKDSQFSLVNMERELIKEGEKLSDMLAMPVKDALGRDLHVDYSDDICNIREILDTTIARRNIFRDSVELQKLTLEQVTHIHTYEQDAQTAIKWMDDLYNVMIKCHSHVGCNIHEIQVQKDELQTFQETGKSIFNYGCQLLEASQALRLSCKLDTAVAQNMLQQLQRTWHSLQAISQEHMTRLRVSAVFHRSVEEYCQQLHDLKLSVCSLRQQNSSSSSGISSEVDSQPSPVVATVAAMEKSQTQLEQRNQLQKFLVEREQLLVEVGRMVRLGRLLKTRLKEPFVLDAVTGKSVVADDLSSDTPNSVGETDVENNAQDENTSATTSSTIIVQPTANNEIGCKAISQKLTDIAEVAESLDAVIRDIQNDSDVLDINSNSSERKLETLRSNSSEDWHSRSTEDDSFATASEGNFTPHSQSSSFQTASGRTSSFISSDKNSFDASEADDSTFAFDMPELASPVNMSYDGSEHSFLSALQTSPILLQHQQQQQQLLYENDNVIGAAAGIQNANNDDQASVADIEDLHSESVTPTPDDNQRIFNSIQIESETELESCIADAPSMEILTELEPVTSVTPEVSSCSNQSQQSSNTNQKPNAAWRRSKYYENITKQTIKGFL
ncbi:SEC14 domain and spectrin repeat-containing protein 1-B [Teleopsis dalmanni]|uniref:SEC14 domain and spectrin repeat-containing protein 1-B n=1 Tax=Teleopsis dalmanni TaxID=139649 RepID=UPI0018CEEE87|nr:SEC14 domain and spectrin repeat-containing protein 1-B [Teleopsis dalmanni]